MPSPDLGGLLCRPPGRTGLLASPSRGDLVTADAQTTVAAMRRRRAASRRLVVLDSGVSDPWQPYRAAPSERQADAYVAAVLHLRGHGLTAHADQPLMRLAWRRGGNDRRLVDALAAQWRLAV